MFNFETFLAQNPWRWDRSQLDFYHIPRDITPKVQSCLKGQVLPVILGPRGCGKSTFLRVLIRALIEQAQTPVEDIFYFDLDDPWVSEFFTRPEGPVRFVKSFTSRPAYLIIDEAQRLRDLEVFLRYGADKGLKLKIVLAGSALRLTTKLPAALAHQVFYLGPLSFKEYLKWKFSRTVYPYPELKARSWSALVALQTAYGKFLSEYFEEYLIYGGYPALAWKWQEASIKKQAWLHQIYAEHLRRDLLDFLGIELRESFHRLVHLLTTQTDSLINYQALSQELQVDRQTTRKYLGILADTLLIGLVEPWGTDRPGAIRKRVKVYFNDSGLRHSVLNLFQGLDTRTDQAAVLKTFIYNQLARFWERQRIHFWQTKAGGEVDFIVESEQGLIVLASQYRSLSPLPAKRDEAGKRGWCGRALRHFIKREQPRQVVVLTKDYLDRIKDGTSFIYLPCYWLFALPEILSLE